MKSRLVTLAVIAGLVGCQNKDDQRKPGAAPPPTTPASIRLDEPYKNDVDKVCNVIERSGAATHESHDRTFLVATWLGKHLETSDARNWLASIQRLTGNAKADALEAEARRVGLAGCPLATEWRSPPTP